MGSARVMLVTANWTVAFLATHPHPNPLITSGRTQLGHTLLSLVLWIVVWLGLSPKGKHLIDTVWQFTNNVSWTTWRSMCVTFSTFYLIFNRLFFNRIFNRILSQFIWNNACHLEIPIKPLTWGKLFEGGFCSGTLEGKANKTRLSFLLGNK